MYHFLDYFETTIEGNVFYQINLLFINDKEHIHTITRCFTRKDIKTKDYLDKLKLFDTSISSRIEYKIKRDGKIGLSFNNLV